MDIFGERLKSLRENKKMTQDELSQIVLDNNNRPVTKQTISYYERGKYDPSIKGLIAIADEFGVDIDYLLGRTDIMNRKHEQLQKIGVLSEEAINGLSTLYSAESIKILDILFRGNSLILLLHAFAAYYEGISEETLWKSMSGPLAVKGIVLSSDMEAYRRQFMNFIIEHSSEIVLKYLDEVREENKNGID